MINNPIVNDFLEQIVDADDLKNIKTIIQALMTVLKLMKQFMNKQTLN